MIDVGNLKMARETLCIAQHAINQAWEPNRKTHSDLIQKMIDQIDIQRPLGPDGKHGNRHTPTCGCSINDLEGEFMMRDRADDDSVQKL